METPLDVVEVRVLGCLLEKELATPEYCPLTLNALVNACNQRSNREPVMALAEPDVKRALATLIQRQWAIVSGEGGRVTKYRHLLAETLGLHEVQQAVLAELLLRGPQTAGELRARAARMTELPDPVTVLGVCLSLEDREPPLIVTLARQPGRKEPRYAHLLCGAPACEAMGESPSAPPSSAAPAVDDEREASLHAEVAALRAEVAALRAEVAALADLVSGGS
jgi:uncharacterized protein YceH (UPF0502 family)